MEFEGEVVQALQPNCWHLQIMSCCFFHQRGDFHGGPRVFIPWIGAKASCSPPCGQFVLRRTVKLEATCTCNEKALQGHMNDYSVVPLSQVVEVHLYKAACRLPLTPSSPSAGFNSQQNLSRCLWEPLPFPTPPGASPFRPAKYTR